MDEQVKLATLTEEQLKTVRELEQELGVCVLAFEQPLALARLSEEQLAKLQGAESELGVCLVAYRKR